MTPLLASYSANFYRPTLCVSVVFVVARCPSVCPSVCLSVTLVYFIQTAEDIVKLFCLPGSAIILVFCSPSAVTQLQWQPLQLGAKYKGGGKIL